MIFYLSCTGNTRWAAERLAEMTNEKVVFIPDAVKGDCAFHIHDGERIGFCLPVHGWCVQPMVREFIERLTFVSSGHTTSTSHPTPVTHNHPSPTTHYCYFLITCGDNCGEYADQLEALLCKKGFKVHTCCSLVMPESYVGLPFMDVDPDLREAEKKMNANGVMQKFADIVVDRRSVRMHIEKGTAPWLLSRVLGRFFYRYLITDKRFKVDASKCIGCGKCVMHCPVGNMEMSPCNEHVDSDIPQQSSSRRLPAWLHGGRCLTCMACYHYCPQHAISFWHFTRNKGQYFFTHNRTVKTR